MMGVQAASAQLFYDFCLDDHVPSDHLLRSIDGHLDFEGLRQTLKPFVCSARFKAASGSPRRSRKPRPSRAGVPRHSR
jgi:hypothetical protein